MFHRKLNVASVGPNNSTDRTARREGSSKKNLIHERPRVCLIDVNDEVVQALATKGYNCYSGTLGPLIEIANSKPRDAKLCKLQYDIPQNLHEYDIVIVDLQNPKTVPYSPETHEELSSKNHSFRTLMSSFPQTTFDPRALSASILGDLLRPLWKKDFILVVFAATHERIEYYPVEVDTNGPHRLKPESYTLYDFLPGFPIDVNRTGTDTTVLRTTESELGRLLARHNASASYEVTFRHPEVWSENRRRIPDSSFLPLMGAAPEHIVSYLKEDEGAFTFVFPNISDKSSFLQCLLETVLPEIVPNLFPFSTQFSWISNSIYHLPNEKQLLAEKSRLEQEYKEAIETIECSLELNRTEYGFLHDLLKQTGNELVKTVEIFLDFLGFKEVENVDETSPALKEEDLRIDSDRGLLVIEVKGIGGTSTDNDCSQISKIRYRRMKERNSLNVFALYIVNHQRYLSPVSRSNPPFNANQISHAISDDRGLLTTYELFNLYFNIIAGFITKDDARSRFYYSGLVQFPPTGAAKFEGEFQIHHNGRVVILDVNGFELKVGDVVVLENLGRYSSAEILGIKKDDESVSSASSGAIGIELSEVVAKDTGIWFSTLSDS